MEPNAKLVAVSATILILVVAGTMSLYYLPLNGISFETIKNDMYCGIEDARTLIITDNETWSSIWTEIHSIISTEPERPFVDFTNEWLIAVFLGERSTGGYLCNITGIERTSLVYKVYYQELDYHGFTQALTFPYHIVSVSGYPLDLPVHFVYTYVSM